jgi:hypothetical protein
MDAGIGHSKVIYGSPFHYFSIMAILFQIGYPVHP